MTTSNACFIAFNYTNSVVLLYGLLNIYVSCYNANRMTPAALLRLSY